MLQRAASNAYSWWWSSHVRIKQGKWLEQSLEDMEEKVRNILEVLEEDADSFSKRAEMYYKKRPELINFVEESYRAYRALAERYEHMSGELQNANNTIANIFPEQVHAAMEYNDDENIPKTSRIDTGKAPKAPENPKFKRAIQGVKRSLHPKPKNLQAKKTDPKVNKEEAKEEIDKLQKGILVLQTEKEFIKSSYETGIAKYWDIEKQIEDMQEMICSLQDEAGVGSVIEDNDARALMTASALKSCEYTLLQLQEQQKKSTEEARVESQRVKDVEVKLKAFKNRYLHQNADNQETCDDANATEPSRENLQENVSSLKQERQELQSICEKVKEYFVTNSTSAIRVVELAEMIDELVTKVLKLESAVASQNALIKRLKSESDDLQKHLQSLEEDKMSLIDDSKKMGDKVRELEEELHGIQVLKKSVEDQSNKLQTDFTETCRDLDDLSEKLQTPEKEDETEIIGEAQVDEGTVLNVEPHRKSQEQNDMQTPVEETMNSNDEAVELEGKTDLNVLSKDLQDPDQDEAKDKSSPPAEGSVMNVQPQKQNEQMEPSNLQNMFSNGLEERERILLEEYTSILQDYRETKRKLSDMERKNQNSLYEVMTQIRELRSANSEKDVEIQSLKQKLSTLRTNPVEGSQQTINGSSADQWKNLFTEFQKRSSSRPMPRSLGELLKEQNIDFATKSRELSVLPSMKGSPTEEDVKQILSEEPHVPPSTVEARFRKDIDGLLKENLEFWMRFSTSSNQKQKFQKKIQGIQEEFLRKDKKQEVGTSDGEAAERPEASQIEKHLRELQSELSVWVEQNAVLKDELQCRFSSLCKIQEEISRVSKIHFDTEDDKFTAQQAAKFQGEVLNMKQENNKVADELQAGLYLVRGLQLEVLKLRSSFHGSIEMSGPKNGPYPNQVRHPTSRNKIPLRSFLFGTKPKKTSIFSCMNPSLQKQYSDLKEAGDGLPR